MGPGKTLCESFSCT